MSANVAAIAISSNEVFLMNKNSEACAIRTVAPADFNLASFFSDVYTFQAWEIFPGHLTKGPKNVNAVSADLGLPQIMSGLRILDIAPWNGFFSFECARRGAAEVISLGPDDPDVTGYNRVKSLLNASNCRYIQGSVYDLDPNTFGTFDIVLFLGLIYHLRHPLLALDRIYEVARHMLYVDGPIFDGVVYDKTLSEEKRKEFLSSKVVNELPMLYVAKGRETGDAFNWFIPNYRAFHALVESSGFAILSKGDDGGGWAWLSAEKDRRPFTPNLEGFNPVASRYDPNN